jgi:iron(III) transport system substrate-binding protein
MKAGKLSADLVSFCDLTICDDWTQKGYILSYDSPELKYYPASAKDGKGFWTVYYAYTDMTGWNTRLVSSQDAPKTYEALLDPKWKGKLGQDAPWQSADSYAFVYMAMEKFGQGWLEKYYKETEIKLYASPTQVAAAVVAGQLPIGVGVSHQHWIREKRLGSPIDFVAQKGAPLLTCGGGIMKDAAHPNAAKLFVDFLLSYDGQKLAVDYEDRFSLREGVPGPKEIPSLKEIEPYYPKSLADYAAKHDQYCEMVKKWVGLA